jgi:hypothetical protein
MYTYLTQISAQLDSGEVDSFLDKIPTIRSGINDTISKVIDRLPHPVTAGSPSKTSSALAQARARMTYLNLTQSTRPRPTPTTSTPTHSYT